MATRNQVLSLFGATPEQIMQQERARQAEFLAAQRDPYQSAGAAIGVGLGRLFGGESQDVAQARQMQEAVAGVDPNDPQALRSLAQTVSSFAPERALQIAAYASQIEEQQRGKPVNFERQAVDESGQPIFRQTFNALGEPTGQTPVMVSVPHVRSSDGNYVPLDPRYANLGTAQPSANANDSQVAQPDYIMDPETKRLVPNPAKSGQAPATQEPFEVQRDPRVTPEAEQAMAGATGPRGGGSMGSITAIPPPPALQAEATFVNPEVLQEEIDGLQGQLKGIPANSPRRKSIQSQINRLRAQKRKFTKGTTRTRGR